MKYPKEKCCDYEWVNGAYCDVMPHILSSDDPNNLLANMEPWKRKVFYITSAVFDTLSSGLHGYLIGPNGDDFERALKVAIEIEASDFATTLSNFKNLFPDGYVPSDEGALFDAIDGILKTNKLNSLDDLIDITIDNDIWKRIRGLHG